MPTKIIKGPIDTPNRLEKLGLKLEEALEVVDAMISAKAECTDNDPPGSRGWSSWRWGIRRLREVKLSHPDWEKDDTDQIASVVNKKLGIRIAVSNTDDGTGVDGEGRYPQNRSRKGGATDRAVHVNQLSFIDTLDASRKVIPLHGESPAPGAIITWYVCTYAEGEQFRAELSCPDGMEDGFFTGFIERIFLADSGDSSGDTIRRRRGGGPDDSEFDISVTRKK